MSLSRSDVVQLLTLWFVVLTFVQTDSSASGLVTTVIGVFAFALLWAIPLYVFVGVASKFDAR
ncbi:hypothetical protein [Halogranum rubrum]|uniref:Uncharacterized protein n=1 Tax=Halogranum salarium B-1 TaxID=1210908 RepID=J3EYX1_9EURY|nr:hypothetical protein [Halogranum salarium]EJN60652.1 hypothetical protein HSB1_12550 [Halogranum salarium B-1]